ncbi:MAG TPA: glycosyltransferase family 4 protein [Solimonas sp.]|nr:glycosyltransferase family 4 protein [Solimonas sp.]
MNILLIHQNFPGQFRYLAPHLAADPKVRLINIGHARAPGLAGAADLLRYELARKPAEAIHRHARPMESAVLYGQAVARVMLALREKGWNPDVVLAHAGWGEALFVKDIWPQTRLVLLTEFFHHGRGVDLGFDPEFPVDLDEEMRRRSANAHLLVALDAADAGVAAMPWQRSLFPAAYQPRIVVNHEGFDVEKLRPDPQARLELPGGVVLKHGDKVVTYVARNLEPARGFHIFMRAAQRILERVPDCHIVVAGGDEVSYGARPKGAAHWREKMLRELSPDLSRLHFLGKLPYETYCRLLQVSAAHVYLTIPFVLSWSLLECMAHGCLVVASGTPPVREVIEDGHNGLLVDFFDVEQIASRVEEVLAQPARYAGLRVAARETVVRDFAVADSLRRYREIIGLPA